MKRAFRVQAIASDILDRLRAAEHDDFDNPIDFAIDEGGGSSLRCCYLV